MNAERSRPPDVVPGPAPRPVKTPVVDIGACTLCEGCIELCPQVFSLNDAGYVQVADLPVYPEKDVEEAIKYCPVDCIAWEPA